MQIWSRVIYRSYAIIVKPIPTYDTVVTLYKWVLFYTCQLCPLITWPIWISIPSFGPTFLNIYAYENKVDECKSLPSIFRDFSKNWCKVTPIFLYMYNRICNYSWIKRSKVKILRTKTFSLRSWIIEHERERWR